MIKINLLPKEARKRVGLWQQIFLLSAILIISFVIIGMWWSHLNNVIEQKQQRKAQIEARLKELEKIIKEIEKFEKRMAELERKLKVIEKLKKEQQMPVRFIEALYVTLEEDVWLKNMNQNGFFASEEAKINVSGTALSQPVVAQYVRNLENSPYFMNVNLKVVQKTQIANQEVRNFSLDAMLRIAKGMAVEDGEDPEKVDEQEP